MWIERVARWSEAMSAAKALLPLCSGSMRLCVAVRVPQPQPMRAASGCRVPAGAAQAAVRVSCQPAST